MAQHGFLFDQGRCFGCQACAVACKNWHGLPPGPLKYLRVYEYEKGRFPDVRVYFQWMPCYHCEAPACMAACPKQAIYKEPAYGAVLVNQQECDGCRLCYDACPYGALAFESDTGGTARKCTMCIDRLETGGLPICVLACPTRALDFGRLSAMISTYGDRRDLEDLPASSTTRPAVVFRPRREKRRLVPYDIERARGLMTARDSRRATRAPIAGAGQTSGELVGRNRLVIKHDSADSLMRHTRNDEG